MMTPEHAPDVAPPLDPTVAAAMERFRQPVAASWGSWVFIGFLAWLNYQSGGVVGAFGVLGLLLLHDVMSVAAMLVLDARRREGLLFPLINNAPNVAVPSWKEAAVIVAGFFAMVAMSIVLLVVFVTTKSEVAKSLVGASIGLTFFTLLPLHPYDGWRLLNLTLFSRSAVLEAVVAVLTGLLSLALAFALQFWVLAAFGVLGLVTLVYQRKVATLARELRGRGVQALPWDDATLRTVTEATHGAFPAAPNQKPEFVVQQLSQHVRNVAQRVSMAPPALLPTVLLLGAYGLSIVYVFVAVVVAFAK